jgi:hypothetical protein
VRNPAAPEFGRYGTLNVLRQGQARTVTTAPQRARGAASPGVTITSIVAGMVVGADSIDDLGVIRHGALPGLFGGIRAPSTWGTFVRGFPWGTVAARCRSPGQSRVISGPSLGRQTSGTAKNHGEPARAFPLLNTSAQLF